MASTATDYTIYYNNINAVSSGAAFQITYPSTITVPSSLTDCYIVVSGTSYPMTCTVSTSTKTIFMSGFTGTAAAGSQLALTLGLITNPTSSTTSTLSMGLTSYTDNTYAYTIDNIASNLVPGL